MNESVDHLRRTEIGAHTITAERDGLLHLVVRGMISESDAVGFKKAMVEHAAQHPAYHFIANVAEMTGITGDARRALVIQDRRYPFGCCYIVGASFTTRILITSIHRARRILQPNAVVASTITIDSEAEARQMIAAHVRKKSTR